MCKESQFTLKSFFLNGKWASKYTFYRRGTRFDVGAKCLKNRKKRECHYWNFDSRPCLARINTKSYLPTKLLVYLVCAIC